MGRKQEGCEQVLTLANGPSIFTDVIQLYLTHIKN